MSLAEGTVLAQALLAPLARFGPDGQAVINLVLSSRPVRSLLELERRAERWEHPPSRARPRGELAPPPRPAPTKPPTIKFEDVRFRYPGTEVDVLNGVSLEIPAGSSLALVGLNGAGKTTLVKLLCRFYEPASGRITVDGVDLREFDPTVWQRHIAAIFQDFARFPASARDNIRVGHLAASDDRVVAAARRVGIADVLAGLPRSWDTVLTREFDDGTDLSGGQWQRVALSRALLAADHGAGC
jgi:ABC-type multidrug transport system fused ATPase/permease subunit